MIETTDEDVISQLRRLGDAVEAAALPTMIATPSDQAPTTEQPKKARSAQVRPKRLGRRQGHHQQNRRRFGVPRALEVVAVIAVIVGVGGVLFGLTRGNDDVTVATASSSASQEGTAPDGTVPDGTVPDGAVPEGTALDGAGDGSSADAADSANQSAIEIGAVEIRGESLPETTEGEVEDDPAIGQVAPEFVAQRYDQSTVAVNHDGQARILLFVSHACPHCQSQIAEASAWLQTNPLPVGVEVVAVSSAANAEQVNFPASAWFADEQWPAEVVVDDTDGTLGAAFGASAYPFTVVVNAEGVVTQRFMGEVPAGELARQASAVSRFPQGEVLEPEEALAVAMAQSALDHECLHAAGVEAPAPISWDWVQTAGEFDVSPIVGIRRGGAAEMIGYHSVWSGGADTLTESAYLDSVDADIREEYSQVLSACDNNRPTNADSANELTALSNRRNELGVAALGDEDSAVAKVVAAWRTCIVDSAGVDAETPDALGRTFAFEERPTYREREVATADVACQQQADFQRIYYTETAALLRQDLGADAGIVDELAQARADKVAWAQGVLAERGIELPALAW